MSPPGGTAATQVRPARAHWQDRRVLVTGHTGFKGAWLSVWLRRLGATVSGFALEPDTKPSLFSLATLDELIDSRIGDVRDLSALEAVMHDVQPEIVFHMAAQSLVRRSYEDPVGTFAANVMGTVHVLEAAREVPSLRAIVIVTSDKCYENREWWWPYREDDAMGGHDPYSSSKGCAELAASAWRRSFLRGASVGVATARAGNVIGGGDWAKDRLVPDCVRAFESGRTVRIRRPGAVRPWQHVLDPLAGYVVLAERLASEPDDFGEAWNFGPPPDQARSVGWVVDEICRRWDDGASWALDEDPGQHEAGLLQVDASKARSRLAWRSALGLEEALEWTVEWYRGVAAGRDAVTLTLDQIDRYGRIGEP